MKDLGCKVGQFNLNRNQLNKYFIDIWHLNHTNRTKIDQAKKHKKHDMWYQNISSYIKQISHIKHATCHTILGHL